MGDTAVTAGIYAGVEALPPDVASWLLSYRPRVRQRALWDSVLAGFVIPAVIELAPATRPTAENYAWSISRMVVWASSQGVPLEREAIFDPDLVERYCQLGLTGPSKNTIRSVLRRVGPRLTKTAPWLPRPTKIHHKTIAPPYTSAEVSALRIDDGRQSSARRQRAARAILALGLGVGADGRWCIHVRGVDVTITPAAVLVTLGAPNARVVPVLAAFEEEIVDLARTAGEEPLVGGGAPGKNKASRMIGRYEAGPERPRLSPPRARATWLLKHLELGTRLPELALAAGFARISSLDELLPLVPPLDDTSSAIALRGPW